MGGNCRGRGASRCAHLATNRTSRWTDVREMNTPVLSARRVLLLVGLLLVSAIGLPGPVAASAGPQTEAEHIMAIAQSKIGARWVFAATGPSSFDCSGFVYYVYH